MKKRTIIIGDVHGCLDELNMLIDQINYNQSQDELFFTGDIINRGPDSKSVWLRVKELGGQSVLGNHEYFLKQNILAGNSEYLNQFELEFDYIYSEFFQDVLSWPLMIETDQFILVHAGIQPGHPISSQHPHVLTTIRTFNKETLEINQPDDPPWFEAYHDSKLLVFGHWAQLEGVTRTNVIGLDTGCVYGKKLSALVLPERQIVSVPALKTYHLIKPPSDF